MTTFKKHLNCVFVLIVLAAVFHTVSAAAENRVYGASISFYSQGGQSMISIPVKIENNSGFMGFAITVTYNPDVFKPVKVQHGEMIGGMFEDSIGYTEVGSFRVLFSGSAECVADGELFTLIFEDLSASTEERTETIGLSYSKQDTFNEQWKDVTFNCEDIKVSLGGTPTEPVSELETEPEESTTDPVVESQPEKKLSARLAEWYESRPVVVRVLLWIFVKPLIRLIAATE